jgi:cytochrome c oxidase assembly protein subunit 15
MARISPTTYRVVTGAAFGSLCTIVLTGALVRLTGSGLGCEDWPRCSQSKFIDVSAGHTFIEQANRLFTGVVSMSVIAAVLLAHLTSPKRRDLIWLSWSLVIGVLAQIIIGGVVVLTGLNPFANMAHFLVSLLLITGSFFLMRRARNPESMPMFRVMPLAISRVAKALIVMASCTLVTGTVVTATGPHAGDEDAVRFGFELSNVARIHSISMLITLTIVIYLLLVSRKSANAVMAEPAQTLLFATLLQAVIGYTQYFTEVPATLVAAHIAGALFFFVATLNIIVHPNS